MPNFRIKFQQYDNYPISTDRHRISTMAITTPSTSGADYYSFSLVTGDSVALAGKVLPGSSANLSVRLLDSDGNLLGQGTGAASNFNQIIGSFTAPATGVYYAYVTADQASDYALSVVRKGTFDIEANNSLATATRSGRKARSWRGCRWKCQHRQDGADSEPASLGQRLGYFDRHAAGLHSSPSFRHPRCPAPTSPPIT